MYMPATKSTRTTDTIQFFPHNCTIPQINANDRFVLAVQDLTNILSEKSPFPFLESQSSKVTLKALHHALGQTVAVARVNPDKNKKKKQHQLPNTAPRVPTKNQPVRLPRVQTRNHPVTRNRTLHKIGTIVRKRFNRGYYEGEGLDIMTSMDTTKYDTEMGMKRSMMQMI